MNLGTLCLTHFEGTLIFLSNMLSYGNNVQRLEEEADYFISMCYA